MITLINVAILKILFIFKLLVLNKQKSNLAHPLIAVGWSKYFLPLNCRSMIYRHFIPCYFTAFLSISYCTIASVPLKKNFFFLFFFSLKSSCCSLTGAYSMTIGIIHDPAFPPQLSSTGTQEVSAGNPGPWRQLRPLHPNVTLQYEHPATVLQLWLCFQLMKLRLWPATANMRAQHKSSPPLSSCQPLIYSCCSCSRSLPLLLLPQRLLHAVCRRASDQWMLTEPCCPPMIYILQSKAKCWCVKSHPDYFYSPFKIQICESISLAIKTGILFQYSTVSATKPTVKNQRLTICNTLQNINKILKTCLSDKK